MRAGLRRAFAVFAILSVTFSAQARNWDVLGVFWKADKVIVSISEPRPDVWPGPRLQTFLDAVGADHRWEFERASGKVYFFCGRDENSARCSFRFQPGPGVEVEPRFVRVRLPLQELRAAGWRVRDDLAPLDFENSNGDHMTIEITAGELRIFATKKDFGTLDL